MKNILNCKLIITDLDGTLKNSNHTISQKSADTLKKCRKNGILVAFATARAERNATEFIELVNPDIVISNGGSLVKYHGAPIFKKQLSAETSAKIISECLRLTNNTCEITTETDDAHYWNSKEPPREKGYEDVIYTDFADFHLPTYKVTAQLFDHSLVNIIAQRFPECETLSYRDSHWHRFAARNADKKVAITKLCEHLGISLSQVAAFGDDVNDKSMIESVGIGVAMDNAVDEVKAVAKFVCESNDNDGVARFIEEYIL